MVSTTRIRKQAEVGFRQLKLEEPGIACPTVRKKLGVDCTLEHVSKLSGVKTVLLQSKSVTFQALTLLSAWVTLH